MLRGRVTEAAQPGNGVHVVLGGFEEPLGVRNPLGGQPVVRGGAGCANRFLTVSGSGTGRCGPRAVLIQGRLLVVPRMACKVWRVAETERM